MGGSYEGMSDGEIYRKYPDDIPSEMKSLDRWIPWIMKTDKSKKMKKVPINFERREVDAFNPENWHSFQEALDYSLKNLCGLGFVLAPDTEILALDYDNAIDEKGLKQMMAYYLSALETYYEISPSRQGVRGIAYHNGMYLKKEGLSHSNPLSDGIVLEMWSSNDDPKKAKRWVTITGDLTSRDLAGLTSGKISTMDKGFKNRIALEVPAPKKKSKKRKQSAGTFQISETMEENILGALKDSGIWGTEFEEGTGKHSHHDKVYGIAGVLASKIRMEDTTALLLKFNDENPCGTEKKKHSPEDISNQVKRAYEHLETGELKIPEVVPKELQREIKESLLDLSGIRYKLDAVNTLLLENTGNFYQLTMDPKESGLLRQKHLVRFDGLKLYGLFKQGDIYKIKYEFMRQVRMDTLEEVVQHLGNKIHTAQLTNQKFSEFLSMYENDLIERGKYDLLREEDIYVDKDGTIHVDTDINQVETSLRNLMELHKITTHPDAFIRSFLYHMISPFSYEIRSMTKKFPYRVLWGKTHGGKTVMESFFVHKGFGQDPNERTKTMQTVKTAITFGQAVEKSRYPLVFDDVNNSWLKTNAEGLKGATDHTKFIARGTRSLDIREFEMRGMPSMTMNEEPDVLKALKDRVFGDWFTESESEKQDAGKWNKLVDSVPEKFMLPVIKEALDGKNVYDIVDAIYYSVKNDGEINNKIIQFSFDLVKAVSEKHGIDFIDSAPIYEDDKTSDIEERFLTFLANQKVTLQTFDAEVGYDDSYYYATGVFFKRWLRWELLPHMRMIDFVNECTRKSSRGEKIIMQKSVWIKSLKNSERAIKVPKELIAIGDETFVADIPFISYPCTKNNCEDCREAEICKCPHHHKDRMTKVFGF